MFAIISLSLIGVSLVILGLVAKYGPATQSSDELRYSPMHANNMANIHFNKI